MSNHLLALVNGPKEKRRDAILALIDDMANRRAILDRLAKEIGKQAQIVHQPTPDGLEPGEPEKYAEICAAAVAQQAAVQAVLGILGPDGLLDNQQSVESPDAQQFVELIDKEGMLRRLENWPEHVKCMRDQARKAAGDFGDRHPDAAIAKVKIFGLGGSGAPHDIVAEIVSNSRKSSSQIEVVHADRPNPDYVDQNTLAIFSSFSGTTEETINCYDAIKHKTPLLVALAKGDDPEETSRSDAKKKKRSLREIARSDKIPFMEIPADERHAGYVVQPRESVCLQITATLTFLARMGLQPGAKDGLSEADLEYDTIRSLLPQWRARFGPDEDFATNPAKRLAFFLLYGIDYQGEGSFDRRHLWNKKVPFVLADRNLRAIGHEVRTQMHERSKLNAAFYEAPEFLHNLVESIRAGSHSAAAGPDHDPWVYYFIRSPDEESRLRLRLDKTIELVLKGKASYAVLNLEGETPYQRAMFATYFNAHMTTYLAMLGGFDPLPVPTMSWLKNVMAECPRGADEERIASTRQRQQLEMH